MVDAVLLGEAHHGGSAFHTGLRLERAGAVVESGMNHAAVVERLVAADAGLFLQDEDALAGMAAGDLHGGGKAEYAAPDDDDVPRCPVHCPTSKP